MYRFHGDGFGIVRTFISLEERLRLLKALGSVSSAGRRGILSIEEISSFANSPKLLDLVKEYSSNDGLPVRAIYFDKSAENNWAVAWHQDLTIAVQEHIDVPGYGPWSAKDGVVHVQPPVEILEQMITVRF